MIPGATPTSALPPKVLDWLDAVPIEDRAAIGEAWECMLGKIASPGYHGELPTSRCSRLMGL